MDLFNNLLAALTKLERNIRNTKTLIVDGIKAQHAANLLKLNNHKETLDIPITKKIKTLTDELIEKDNTRKEEIQKFTELSEIEKNKEQNIKTNITKKQNKLNNLINQIESNIFINKIRIVINNT